MQLPTESLFVSKDTKPNRENPTLQESNVKDIIDNRNKCKIYKLIR